MLKKSKDVRVRSRFVDYGGRSAPPLCDACWIDPHNKMSECKHGAEREARDA